MVLTPYCIGAKHYPTCRYFVFRKVNSLKIAFLMKRALQKLRHERKKPGIPIRRGAKFSFFLFLSRQYEEIMFLCVEVDT
jgi:hypothetical protein